MVAHFAESGGIFQGAEVSYRGVTVGQVSDMRLTSEGVDVVLDIQNDTGTIPNDTRALVANRSAVGEQYVELQPETKNGPYLGDGGEIPVAMTATPISTTKLLTDLDTHGQLGQQDAACRPSSTSSARPSTGPVTTSAG